MNIFVLDTDPELAAQYHVDRHVIKMILESVQMISAALRFSHVDAGYKMTHFHHPCTKWACESLDNVYWLKDLTKYLNLEYQYRFGHTRNHKSYDFMLTLPDPNIPSIGLTPFAQAMPPQYKHQNAVIAYRQYYNGEKRHIFKWSKRETPSWIV